MQVQAHPHGGRDFDLLHLAIHKGFHLDPLGILAGNTADKLLIVHPLLENLLAPPLIVILLALAFGKFLRQPVQWVIVIVSNNSVYCSLRCQ